jgi:transcriptional antiterminator RfaH
MDWYALHTKPNKEEIAWRLVRAKGYEVFYPRLTVRPVNPRARKIRPYFPGYMFVCTDLDQVGLTAFHFVPHIRGLVAFGGEPARVPEALIFALQKRVQQAAALRRDPLQGVARGEAVMIQDGPLTGYEAVFDERIPGRARVRVLLTILGGRPIRVVLGADQIVRTAHGQT